MGFWSFLNHAWNLPSLVMLGLVAVFLALQLLGLVGGDSELDHHADVGHDALADGDAGGLLALFGVGRVPLMVVWVTFCIFAGFTGLAVNRWVFEAHEGHYPGWAFPVSLASSSVVGLVAVRLFAGLAARLVDTGGRGATAKHELSGRLGVVASPVLDGRFGEIRVQDPRGQELLVHGRRVLSASVRDAPVCGG
ncbi:MAG: YqiJ family protein [Myxococcaceae bacterium]|nr:YqiJ family protein [Myxococcaceae bacterium]MCI0673852.1 YqiJ family protein [Myxococcaceae bacterium]